MTNQTLVPASLLHTAKRPSSATRGRHAAVTPKRGADQGTVVGAENPKNRKSGPG